MNSNNKDLPSFRFDFSEMREEIDVNVLHIKTKNVDLLRKALILKIKQEDASTFTPHLKLPSRDDICFYLLPKTSSAKVAKVPGT